MPKRTDIQSILVIGAGPIVIGQACEFDYSGTQAIKALKEEGYRIVLVNSNPATIMTDPDFADATYIEPITPEVIEAIIAKEKPDAVLPTLALPEAITPPTCVGGIAGGAGGITGTGGGVGAGAGAGGAGGAAGALIGAVMKDTKGQADAARVRELLLGLLA